MADLEPLARTLDDLAYRAHNPRWAYAPTSGAGAERHGGRFNRKGLAALYLSLDINTAWLEAQQGLPFKAQPMTLVAYRVNCRYIADLTDPGMLVQSDIEPADLGCAWEDLAGRGDEPPSWRLADTMIAAGFQGAMVPSFAPAPNPQPDAPQRRNLVLWCWSTEPPCAVQVIDDFGRLPRDDRSWGQSLRRHHGPPPPSNASEQTLCQTPHPPAFQTGLGRASRPAGTSARSKPRASSNGATTPFCRRPSTASSAWPW